MKAVLQQRDGMILIFRSDEQRHDHAMSIVSPLAGLKDQEGDTPINANSPAIDPV